MGHATRCVPIIRALLKRNAEIILAGEGPVLEFLQQNFPGIRRIHFPGVAINYSTGGNMPKSMAVQTPSILRMIYTEHRALEKIIVEHNIDIVISDNRFGLWSKKAYSVYITHQVMIKPPYGMMWAEPWLYRFHRWFIRHYDTLWVPDLPGSDNLSGDLSHKYTLPPHGRYIGILSRFAPAGNSFPGLKKPRETNLLVMLSGPEPQRTIFENMILDALRRQPLENVVILRGKPGSQEEPISLPGVDIHHHLADEPIRDLILGARRIICRPGYSSLMDLVTLGKNAVLVPTPGQTEQEYLAGYLAGTGNFYSMKQKDFSLEHAIEAAGKLNDPVVLKNDPNLLTQQIDLLFMREFSSTGP